MTKYNSRGKISIAENDYGDWIKGLGYMIDEQVKYLLQPEFTMNGEKFRKIEYVADFVIRLSPVEDIVIDYKGFETTDFKIKRKWFMRTYNTYLYCIKKASKYFYDKLDSYIPCLDYNSPYITLDLEKHIKKAKKKVMLESGKMVRDWGDEEYKMFFDLLRDNMVYLPYVEAWGYKK